MILLIREYLASLKEREELDAILPDLLTADGFEVYSRPSIGTTQYGVDVAAIGKDDDGRQKVFLFSIKSGDLTRQEWNSDADQSIRPSLEEIKDAYIPTRIPDKYTDLPIVICLCFGGGIKENVQQQVHGYTKQNKTDKISFQHWDGDVLARKIEQGILRENLFPAPVRELLRKASAMVQEPDQSKVYFKQLIAKLVDSDDGKPTTKIRIARQINISLWILFAWSREAGNLEAAYVMSEHALLRAWDLLKEILNGQQSKKQENAAFAYNQLADLNFAIWNDLYGKKILPYTDIRDGLSTAVNSAASVDTNLKLFETIGRLSLHGLWKIWLNPTIENLPAPITGEADDVDELATKIIEIISHNRALLLPIKDDQAIDIALTITFLLCRPKFQTAVNQWLSSLIENASFAYAVHGPYPTIRTSYWDLVGHPKEKDKGYREDATAGSVLYPLISYWAAILGQTQTLEKVAEFAEEELGHCTMQFWFPDSATEDEIYSGTNRTGNMLTDIPISSDPNSIIKFVGEECSFNKHFDEMLSVELGHWILVLLACRYNRLPLPPHIWSSLVKFYRADT